MAVRFISYEKLISILTPILLLGLWEIGARTGFVDTRFFSSPGLIAHQFLVLSRTGAWSSTRITTSTEPFFHSEMRNESTEPTTMPRIFTSPRDPRVQLEHGFSPALRRQMETVSGATSPAWGCCS